MYATALCQPYPVGDYKWVNPSILKGIDWKTYDPAQNNNTGYFLRVSLRYPRWVQDKSAALPFAPEKFSVQLDELPQYQKDKVELLQGKIPKTFVTQPRLIAHCYDRKDYCIHHSALKYYLNEGLELVDITEGFSFREEPIFKKMIEFTIQKRREAKSNAMNAVLKLICNSLYGRSLMSNKERLQIKFSESSCRARHLLSLGRCTGFKIINANVLMVLLRPPKIVLSNPIILGATCLDRSKVIFYNSYYGVLKGIFGDDISFNYCDTDSLICSIRDPNKTVLQKHVQFEQHFDFSKISDKCGFFQMFPEDPGLKMRNAGKLGLLKIEAIDVRRGIFLKPKVYILDDREGHEEKRAKGVMKDQMNDVHFNTYEAVCERDEVFYVKAKLIRSFNHNLYNISVRKLGFHSLSMSRAFIAPNTSLPFGHYMLENETL